jgi:hypothetical protein
VGGLFLGVFTDDLQNSETITGDQVPTAQDTGEELYKSKSKSKSIPIP